MPEQTATVGAKVLEREKEYGREGSGLNEEEAHQSVDALIDDLKHIMGTRPHTGWSEMADAALTHHDPLIPEHLLTWQYRRLQRAAHLTLHGLVASNAEQIGAGILDIRTIQSLDRAPAPSKPRPPAARHLTENDSDRVKPGSTR